MILICTWHIETNIAKYHKGDFKEDEWQEFLNEWKGCYESPGNLDGTLSRANIHVIMRRLLRIWMKLGSHHGRSILYMPGQIGIVIMGVQ